MIKSSKEMESIAKDTVDLAMMAVAMRTFALLERERVNAYTLPVLEKYKPRFEYGTLDGRMGRDTKPEDIEKTGDLFLLDSTDRNEEILLEFYEELDEVHLDHGWKGKKGHCPALTQENIALMAENDLENAWFKRLGIDGSCASMKHRKEMLKIALGSCVLANPEAFERLKKGECVS